MRQLSFLPRARVEHGGDATRGKRKTARPFDRRRPLHLVLGSGRARGARSLLRHKWRVHALLMEISKRYDVRVHRFANVGTHLHLLIQARSRENFQGFLREFAGVVAATVTGAVKGRPEKFWDGLAWTKVVEWGRQFRNAASYILLNVMEAHGHRDRASLARLERDGFLILEAEPGS